MIGVDYSNKKCCLNCDGFCWWDGDYCCFPNFKIHQYGYENGPWFNEDIDNTMKTPDTCEDYDYTYHEIYTESDNPYIKEYKKFKEWDKLCRQLENHVLDASGYYEKYTKSKYF